MGGGHHLYPHSSAGFVILQQPSLRGGLPDLVVCWSVPEEDGDGFHGWRAAVLPAGSRRSAAARRILAEQAGAGVVIF